MFSDATFPGAIQVTPSGEAMLLMADRQTTGGYPQMAIVISADLPRAGQLAPGDWVSFDVVLRPEEEVLDAIDELQQKDGAERGLAEKIVEPDDVSVADSAEQAGFLFQIAARGAVPRASAELRADGPIEAGFAIDRGHDARVAAAAGRGRKRYRSKRSMVEEAVAKLKVGPRSRLRATLQ